MCEKPFAFRVCLIQISNIMAVLNFNLGFNPGELYHLVQVTLFICVVERG